MGRVVTIDARSCAYYVRGRCRRPTSGEALEAWRCVLLQERRRLSRMTLSDLARLDRFQVGGPSRALEKARQRIIEKTFVQMRRVVCPDRVAPQGPAQVCGRQDAINCLLLMPRCQGRFEHYFTGGGALALVRREAPNQGTRD
ncbi:MAG: hypothetical protein KJ621_14220 [Proteobacteria bacterium]|nr:hypothetical protein [Pseudomonadota bacterium]